jgi:hypothetical protein
MSTIEVFAVLCAASGGKCMALGFVNGESRLQYLISATGFFTIPTEAVPFHLAFPRYTAPHCLEAVDAMKELSVLIQLCHCIISYSTMAP